MKKYIMPFFAVLLVALLFGWPLLMLLVQSFLPSFDAGMVAQGAVAPQLWFNPFSTEQYAQLFAKNQDFWRCMGRNLLWAVAASVVQVLVSNVNGYLLAKYKGRLFAVAGVLCVFAMVMPLQMFLIPTYRIADALGVINTSLTLYLPLAFAPFGTFFMRQICVKLPNEWIEQFRMEGEKFRDLFRMVIFPFCRLPAFVLFLLSFVECWGMVEQPLILLTTKACYPLSMLLYDMRISQPQVIYAASVVSLLPIVLFLLCWGAKAGCEKLVASNCMKAQ